MYHEIIRGPNQARVLDCLLGIIHKEQRSCHFKLLTFTDEGRKNFLGAVEITVNLMEIHRCADNEYDLVLVGEIGDRYCETPEWHIHYPPSPICVRASYRFEVGRHGSAEFFTS